MTLSRTTPMAWQRKWISDLFEVRAAGDIDWSRWSREQDSGYPFPVYANGRTESGLHGYASYAVEKGDAITLTARGTPGELGFAFFRGSAFTPIGRLLVLRSKGEADARFFASYINAVIRFAQENTGVAQLTAPQVARCQVDVPPLSEQRAIAAALSDVDALLGGLDRFISKKRDLKQAAMQQLLTGSRRLPGFQGKWEVKRLGDILKVRHGKSQHHITSTDGTYPILATGGEIGRTNHCLYDKPSVLIGRKGTIDAPQYVEIPFWTIDTLFFTEIASDTSPKFIFYKFNTINWRNYNEASGVPSLNASTIESIEFDCPKLEEQIAIATVLSDMDAEIAILEHRRDKTRALKLGMMQELLTGKTRLI